MAKHLSLGSLERLGWRFGLETITALLKELGDPHLSLRCIHVAGSNGKGSTCALLASYLKTCGFKTGFYTSPHLCDIRERFRIDGVWISPKDFNRHTRRVLDACAKVKKRLGHSPTHFEALTAIAFSWFKEQKVDWTVLEVGLGGRLDATNVIPSPAVSLISPVGLEHQDILGKTLGKIAWEKAGILKKGRPAATVQVHPEALKSIERTALEKGAKLWVGGRDFKFKKERNGFHWECPGFEKSFRLPNASVHQIVNVSLALAGLQRLKGRGVPFDEAKIQRSLLVSRWPGRMEVLSAKPLTLLDGAHNPDAAKALVTFLKERYPGKRWIVLNGFLKDKDYRSVASILQPVTALSIVTEPENDRAEKGDRVFEAWEKAGARTLLIKDWRTALGLAVQKRTGDYPLLITGSLYLGGDCRRALVGMKGLDRL